jgi:hypothetical protein
MRTFPIYLVTIFLSLFGLPPTELYPASFVKPSDVPDSTWREVKPYFLPTDHPIKAKLDKIFSSSRVTANHRAMRKAGFSCHDRGKRLIVAKHPQLKGYLIKTYLDIHEFGAQDWKAWIHRIQGAQQIQKSIKKHGYTDLMKVPKKWIYLIPSPPPATGAPHPRHFVLVVEDMRPYSYLKNAAKFYFLMDKKRLTALYTIVRENGLTDSLYIDNIPFCRDGKHAFLDTEHFHTEIRPIRYERLLPKLSSEMQDYWNQLAQ